MFTQNAGVLSSMYVLLVEQGGLNSGPSIKLMYSWISTSVGFQFYTDHTQKLVAKYMNLRVLSYLICVI